MMSEENRIRLVKIALPASFLLGLVFAFKLWISSRSYPLTPVVPAFARIPYPLDYLLVAVLALLLIAVAVLPRPRVALIALLILLFALALGDQSRWWPSFYE